MPLTDVTIRKLAASAAPVKRADGGGLFILVTPTGGKWWRLSYRFAGKQKTLSLGTYPEVTLAMARERREAARKLLAQGIDPGVERKARQQALTVDALFARWFAKNTWAPAHATRNRRRYEIHVAPHLGSLPVADVTPPVVLQLLERVQASGTLETGHRVKGILSGLFQFALVQGLVASDPTVGMAKALIAPAKRHYPAPIAREEVGRLLRLLHSYDATPTVNVALRLGPYLAVRPGELRHMRWAELTGGDWHRVVSKTGEGLVTPLPTQALALLDWLRPITGAEEYVLPSSRGGGRPMSDAAVLAAYRYLGIPADALVGHSWRATFRTVADEVLGFRPDVVEQALGHAVRDALGRAYNRTQHLEARRQLAQAWADWLDATRAGDPATGSPGCRG